MAWSRSSSSDPQKPPGYPQIGTWRPQIWSKAATRQWKHLHELSMISEENFSFATFVKVEFFSLVLVHIFTFPMNFYIDWKNAFRFCQFFTVYFSLRAVAPALKDTFVILYCKEQVMLNIICLLYFQKKTKLYILYTHNVCYVQQTYIYQNQLKWMQYWLSFL